MYNLLNIYDCPKCGERLSDQVSVREDFGNDEHYTWWACDACNSTVIPRVSYDIQTRQPIYEYREVDDERARWANGFYDDLNDEDDLKYWEYECKFCGGTIAEDYSTCWCDEFADDLPF